MLLTGGRSYVGNDVTHSTLLNRACACSYKNLPKYRSYRVSNTGRVTNAVGTMMLLAVYSIHESFTEKMHTLIFNQIGSNYDILSYLKSVSVFKPRK